MSFGKSKSEWKLVRNTASGNTENLWRWERVSVKPKIKKSRSRQAWEARQRAKAKIRSERGW